MRNLFMRVVVAVLIAGPLQLAVSAQRSWVEVTSPHFTVVSDDGERAARAIAWQFEQIRSAMQVVWSWARVDTARPILVFALKDEASMKALAPRFWEQTDGVRPESVFVEGVDRYHIALRSDVKASDREGINPYMNAYWSYVALVLDSSFERDLPLWLQRGLAGCSATHSSGMPPSSSDAPFRGTCSACSATRD
jgi:hypothetical protein